MLQGLGTFLRSSGDVRANRVALWLCRTCGLVAFAGYLAWTSGLPARGEQDTIVVGIALLLMIGLHAVERTGERDWQEVVRAIAVFASWFSGPIALLQLVELILDTAVSAEGQTTLLAIVGLGGLVVMVSVGVAALRWVHAGRRNRKWQLLRTVVAFAVMLGLARLFGFVAAVTPHVTLGDVAQEALDVAKSLISYGPASAVLALAPGTMIAPCGLVLHSRFKS